MKLSRFWTGFYTHIMHEIFIAFQLFKTFNHFITASCMHTHTHIHTYREKERDCRFPLRFRGSYCLILNAQYKCINYVCRLVTSQIRFNFFVFFRVIERSTVDWLFISPFTEYLCVNKIIWRWHLSAIKFDHWHTDSQYSILNSFWVDKTYFNACQLNQHSFVRRFYCINFIMART